MFCGSQNQRRVIKRAMVKPKLGPWVLPIILLWVAMSSATPLRNGRVTTIVGDTHNKILVESMEKASKIVNALYHGTKNKVSKPVKQTIHLLADVATKTFALVLNVLKQKGVVNGVKPETVPSTIKPTTRGKVNEDVSLTEILVTKPGTVSGTTENVLDHVSMGFETPLVTPDMQMPNLPGIPVDMAEDSMVDASEMMTIMPDFFLPSFTGGKPVVTTSRQPIGNTTLVPVSNSMATTVPSFSSEAPLIKPEIPSSTLAMGSDVTEEIPTESKPMPTTPNYIATNISEITLTTANTEASSIITEATTFSTKSTSDNAADEIVSTNQMTNFTTPGTVMQETNVTTRNPNFTTQLSLLPTHQSTMSSTSDSVITTPSSSSFISTVIVTGILMNTTVPATQYTVSTIQTSEQSISGTNSTLSIISNEEGTSIIGSMSGESTLSTEYMPNNSVSVESQTLPSASETSSMIPTIVTSTSEVIPSTSGSATTIFVSASLVPTVPTSMATSIAQSINPAITQSTSENSQANLPTSETITASTLTANPTIQEMGFTTPVPSVQSTINSTVMVAASTPPVLGSSSVENSIASSTATTTAFETDFTTINNGLISFNSTMSEGYSEMQSTTTTRHDATSWTIEMNSSTRPDFSTAQTVLSTMVSPLPGESSTASDTLSIPTYLTTAQR